MRIESASHSRTIETMRFPLILLVLFQHSVGGDLSPMRVSLDGANIYHFVTELISHHLCSIAVPCFFTISGFLFFSNLQSHPVSWAWVKNKWQRRFLTLLIPFLFWNLFNVMTILSVTAFFKIAGLPIVSDQMPVIRSGPLYWFITGPIDFPLWYLRDLIFLSFLAPLLYFPFSKAPRMSLMFLLAVYLFSNKFDAYPSLAFYGLGCWMGIRRKDFLKICRQRKSLFALLATLLSILATVLYGCPGHYYFWLLFIPFGMMTFVNLCDRLLEDFPKIGERMICLSETVFFIYAVHEIYILGWSKGLLLRIFGDVLTGHWICYWIAPLITLLVCLTLYYLLKKRIPNMLAFTCGGRIESKV